MLGFRVKVLVRVSESCMLYTQHTMRWTCGAQHQYWSHESCRGFPRDSPWSERDPMDGGLIVFVNDRYKNCNNTPLLDQRWGTIWVSKHKVKRVVFTDISVTFHQRYRVVHSFIMFRLWISTPQWSVNHHLVEVRGSGGARCPSKGQSFLWCRGWHLVSLVDYTHFGDS
jgi:hypothetical protein